MQRREAAGGLCGGSGHQDVQGGDTGCHQGSVGQLGQEEGPDCGHGAV